MRQQQLANITFLDCPAEAAKPSPFIVGCYRRITRSKFRPSRGQGSKLPLELARVPLVVAVKKRDVVAFSGRDTAVAGGRSAGVAVKPNERQRADAIETLNQPHGRVR